MPPAFEQEIHRLHSRLCAGLADPKRVLLLYALSESSRSVTELAEALQLPQPSASRHLKILRERGLVIAERQGQSVFYKLFDRRILQALDLMRDVLADILATQASLSDSVSESLPQRSASKEQQA
ncbi:MAG: metalloregulator ArsR/SmtB family transcription factor [Anaerolineales bacterium]|jgi:ArsR family transcriptional regulator